MKTNFLKELNKKNDIECIMNINSRKDTDIHKLNDEIYYLRNSLQIAETEKIKHIEQNIIVIAFLK